MYLHMYVCVWDGCTHALMYACVWHMYEIIACVCDVCMIILVCLYVCVCVDARAHSPGYPRQHRSQAEVHASRVAGVGERRLPVSIIVSGPAAVGSPSFLFWPRQRCVRLAEVAEIRTVAHTPPAPRSPGPSVLLRNAVCLCNRTFRSKD